MTAQTLKELFDFLWPLAIAAVPISTVAAGISKFIKAQKGFTKWLISFICTIVPMVGYALLNTKSDDPRIIAAQTALIAFFATPFYLAVVKPLFLAITTQLAKVRAYDEQLKSAAEPLPPPADEPPVNFNT